MRDGEEGDGPDAACFEEDGEGGDVGGSGYSVAAEEIEGEEEDDE